MAGCSSCGGGRKFTPQAKTINAQTPQVFGAPALKGAGGSGYVQSTNPNPVPASQPVLPNPIRRSV